MAIIVSGSNPTVVTAVSDTTTVNTTFPTNQASGTDRHYEFDDNIVGIINAGVHITGPGLRLAALGATPHAISLIHNGEDIQSLASAAAAVELDGNGGTISYTGSGDLNALADNTALKINAFSGAVGFNQTGGSIFADRTAISISSSGAVTFTQSGSILSAFDNGVDCIIIDVSGLTSSLVANLDGTIVGDRDGFHTPGFISSALINFTGTIITNSGDGLDTQSTGPLTINSSGDIDAGDSALRASGVGGRVTVNVTGGQLHADFDGIRAGNNLGDILISMTGGQIGSAAQRVGDNGIHTTSVRGNIEIAAANIFSTNDAVSVINGVPNSSGNVAIAANGAINSLARGIFAAINAGSAGNIAVTNNSTIASAGFAIQTNNAGTGITTIINNGTATGSVGVLIGTGPANVINFGTITGTTGATPAAIQLGAGNDVLTIAPSSLINGNVFGDVGSDTLQLGGSGTGNFNLSNIVPPGSSAQSQYLGFEIFKVVSGTWILSGTGVDAWQVIGGTLGGNGVIGGLNVLAGGTVAPGASAGILTTGSATIAAGATFAVELGGIAPGAGGHDQVKVAGTVALAGSLALSQIGGFKPPTGSTFTIIDNDGVDAVTGTFADLANGASFSSGGETYQISYTGGDGNDVVLTALNDAPVITSNGGASTAILSRLENRTAVTAVTATDPDGPSLTFSIFGGADAGRFKINATTGALSFKTAPDFEAPTDVGHNNSYVVRVRASDGSLTDLQTITVLVRDVAPVITGTNAANVLNGTSEEDTIRGLGGNDTLFGRLGPDILVGGSGNDRLIGGLGKDTMTGGLGADDFDFNNVAEIGRGATRDIIRDFTHLIDDIDLATIDANGAARGHAFTFLSTKGKRSTAWRVNCGGSSRTSPAPSTTRQSSKATLTATELLISRFS